MPNVKLETAEGHYLRAQLCAVYDSQTKQKLVVNSVRANYVWLGEEITKSVQSKLFDNYRFAKDFVATDAQLQRLFFSEALTFRDDFVNACYCYAFGQTRNTFFKAPKNAELVNAWRSESPEISQNTEGVATLGIGEEPLLKSTTNGVFENLKIVDWTKIVLGIAVIGLSIILFLTHQKLQKTRLWYRPPPIEEEVKLKEDLTFVNDPIFRERIRKLVNSLMFGYQNLASKNMFDASQSDKSLKWYRDTLNKEHVRYQGQGGYTFYIDKVNWTGFTREEDGRGSPQKRVEDTAHTLFLRFANFLLDSLNGSGKDSTYLNKLLHIPEGDYSAVLLYVGFKADTMVFESRELMARFPVYDIDFVAAGKGYVMTSRPWWRDAVDKERRENFSWLE